ncbi:flagella basal body P-ring formation protein FlgA [Octadecabacter temperatus]|uniref:Flagella basal body P-ring formation protein FlgA n=1 Tax=Octadecabacter temperatus TaxID=1458307 RepID=A0A0K0YA54_9RHOB|nr:flagellar basal body P-ring formation chaperone FlgA [Octadecabacter temperatus]AKS47801.1 flagellar basal body P-ring biosynthesis protein FlgA [Octadecabacter temperatus]SIO38294.1 flagella basal body P-ring formation protein FlgA [Octadecabacter temperatus]
MIRFIAFFVVLAAPVTADTIVATRTIPARSIIGVDDVLLREVDVAGALSAPDLAIGQEARVALYAGRPIRAGDIGPPAVIERNQIITLVYQRNGVVISTEGRALDRAGPGDVIRVMNLTSRTTVSAQIDATGTAFVNR